MRRFAAGFLLLLAFCPQGVAEPLSDRDARVALAALLRAGEEGLEPSRYPADPRDRASVKSALLSFTGDMTAGRADLRTLDSDVALPPSAFDPVAALDNALVQGTLGLLLDGLAPPYVEYARLKSALARYRDIAAKGGWPRIAAADDRLLRLRLGYEDDITGISDSVAIGRFQVRHGLAADGIAGPATLAALNVPASIRADIIAANMERWRWLPRSLEDDRIMINVADARLALILQGKSVLQTRVIVGRPQDPTPILRAEGGGITLNPSWTVPHSIAAREILPKLKRNPAYLASQDMVLLNGPAGDPHGLHIPWRSIAAGSFPYEIRQRPGPKNPLGRIKIELPNRFSVYLHDTPGKAAFNSARRDLSHGCVRVEQILPLASYVLTADLSATRKIADAIDSGKTTYLPLRKKLPVYFLYATAFANSDGTLHFRSDIYGRDSRMLAAKSVLRTAAARVICSRA